MSLTERLKEYLKKNWHARNGYRQMLKIALPLIISMGTATVMEVTDRLFLSHYSVVALAASVPASSASLLFLFAVMGITGYVGVFIAHYTGARIRDQVGTALWQSIYLSLAGGVLLASLWFAAEPLFRLAGAEGELLRQEIIYFRILCVGGVVALLGYSVGCFFTGRGYSRQVMYANIIATISNVPLNYALIYGKFGLPELGIAGAGIATVIGWTISFVILAVQVFTKENDRRYAVLRNRAVNWSYIRRMLRYGTPSGVELFMEMLAGTLFIFMAGYLGSEALAASNIAFTVNSVAYLPMVGIYTATSILVGQG
ncbi:MAG: MATE family efflux transporter, partial [Desulfovibrionaceae bacterium]|nr:MATE family efflux transporter [Desulfovibrionaceae bacterium]